MASGYEIEQNERRVLEMVQANQLDDKFKAGMALGIPALDAIRLIDGLQSRQFLVPERRGYSVTSTGMIALALPSAEALKVSGSSRDILMRTDFETRISTTDAFSRPYRRLARIQAVRLRREKDTIHVTGYENSVGAWLLATARLRDRQAILFPGADKPADTPFFEDRARSLETADVLMALVQALLEQ